MAVSKFGRLFQDVTLEKIRANQYGPSVRTITNGSLVTFGYQFAKNDLYPLVILTRVTGKYFSGLNLHYLSFNTIKEVLQKNQMNACNPLFDYQKVKLKTNLLGSFRRYKRVGIRNLKRLDCDLILNALATPRAIDPQQVEAIRQSVKEQISQLFNIGAKDLI